MAWGAGIKNPAQLLHSSQSDDGFRFVDDHKHHMPTPVDWGLTGIERVDVNQADIAPLMVVVRFCDVSTMVFHLFTIFLIDSLKFWAGYSCWFAMSS